jgi:DNA repair protein RadC
MPIRSWDPTDQPRERLRTVGARYLSRRELIALLVGTGGAAGGVFTIADRLLSVSGGSLRRMAATDIRALQEVPGVGEATASKVLAALELGRRTAAEVADDDAPIRGPDDVFRRMHPRLRGLPQEEFHALVLNTRHRVVREVAVTRGILDASLVHPREVFRIAVVEGAAGVVLVHNHPSGDPTPSSEDRAVTRQLVAAGRALGIPVLDHVVIGDGTFRSVVAEVDGHPGSQSGPIPAHDRGAGGHGRVP